MTFFLPPFVLEKVQRDEPKCRCNPTSTAVGDRHRGTTVHIRMTSRFSTHSLNALQSFPSQHVQDSCSPPTFYLHHFHQLFKPVAQADMLPSFLHKCTPELHNVISGWQSGDKRVEEFLSRTRSWEGLERHLFLSQHQWRTAEDCISLKDTCLQHQNSDSVNSKEKMASYSILITA